VAASATLQPDIGVKLDIAGHNAIQGHFELHG
jgi:hypothetical protein